MPPVLPHPALPAHPSRPAELPAAVLGPIPPQGAKPLIAMSVLSPQGSTPSCLLDASNSWKANVDRPWPCSTSSIPSLPQESLPPPSCAAAAPQAGGQPHRPAAYHQHQPDLTPSSSPAQLASAPWWGPGAAEEGAGSPFSSSWEGCGLCSCKFLLPLQHRQSLRLAPANTQPPPGAGAGSGFEILYGLDRHTESPSLPTHDKQPSVKKTTDTRKKFLRCQNKNPDQ